MFPISYQADFVAPRDRVTTLLRYFMVIPHVFVLFFYAVAFYLSIIATWFSVVLTGNYPPALYEFNAKVVRYAGRVNGYFYLLTDAYPPFNGDEDPAYPVHVEIGPPQPEYDRLKALLRIFLLIPVWIMPMLYGTLIGAVATVAWVVILVTGRQQPALQELTRMGASYTTKATGYMALMSDRFPPLTDEPRIEPGGPSVGLPA